MARPTARVLTLLELLQSGGLRTVTELADRLGVDERTVRRYAGHLIDLDVPVESVRGRYGGYRLGPGYRLPPLMLSDDEALAVLLGLVAGRRTGLLTAAGTASETAAAKIRRVLPERLGRRLDAVLGSLAFTAPAGEPASEPAGEPSVPETAVLLAIADAVSHHRPVSIRYTDAGGRRSERTLHPYGLVAHSGRWYVTGADPAIGEDRTFRLDRIAGARTLPGSFDPPSGPGPAERVLTGLATAPYRHEVTLRVQGSADQIRTRLPAGIAIVTEASPVSGAGQDVVPWARVELRAERLDWLPAVLASMDLPFLIERPDELRDLVVAFADRLARSARRSPPAGEGDDQGCDGVRR
ncbi:YafY family transcriptional regulator [Nonomuraea fuscirosea]|uniref:helix-turn-helix transcriptional regulator n=1 Tax=Nonomuraea fuscirosea TaxID=1291556 RepID=UPI002DD915F2|nr:YafY family protein [Nonomuraea fuscirosea]WSA57287.1 YafY family transcriptional regulator [Nonomuraea fuscirosea]